MKLFIFLSVVAFFLLLLYWRMRPYLHAVQRALRVVKQMQEGDVTGVLSERDARAARPVRADDRQLIKCAGCGTWVPEGRAVTPAGGPRGAAYCSHTCYEENKLAAKTADKR